MDWFLYDRDLRHEKVNDQAFVIFIFLKHLRCSGVLHFRRRLDFFSLWQDIDFKLVARGVAIAGKWAEIF